MSEVTFVPDEGASCASVHEPLAERVINGEITVVVMCSRCPAETPIGGATQPWSVVLVDNGRGVSHKVLCTECARQLQLWFLSTGEGGRG